MTLKEARQVRDTIGRLADRGLPVNDFSRSVAGALLASVPAEGTCLMTVDPATLLPTEEFVENGLPADALLRMVDIELREPDVNKWVDLAQTRQSAASLSDATRGDLDASTRQREIRRPGGFSDEMRVLLTTGTGCWGQLTVFREARRPYFTSAETALVSSAAAVIAEGLRRSILLDDIRHGATDTGMVVIDVDDRVSLINPAGEQWLDELGAGERAGSELPLVVAAVVRRARVLADASAPSKGSAGQSGYPAVARARTAAGEWLIVRGSLMGREAGDPVTVILEPARRSQLAPLMVQAYGFTETERRVTELIAQGLSTRQIANRLKVTQYTVQDHLKAIFRKSDTGSRGDLVSRLFLDHHASRLTRSHQPSVSTPTLGPRD